MANRSYRNLAYSANGGYVAIEGGFVCNGSSNPTVFQGPQGLTATLPMGVSAIVRTGVGTYTITLLDNFFALIYAGADLAMGTAANNFSQFNGFVNLSSGGSPVGTYTTFVGGTATDIAAASNTNIASFYFGLKNSSAS